MGAKAPVVVVPDVVPAGDGLKGYFKGKIEELELMIKDKAHNLRRLEAQRNELNTQGDFVELRARMIPNCCVQSAQRTLDDWDHSTCL